MKFKKGDYIVNPEINSTIVLSFKNTYFGKQVKFLYLRDSEFTLEIGDYCDFEEEGDQIVGNININLLKALKINLEYY